MNLKQRLKYWLYNSCPGWAGRFPYWGTRVHFPRGAVLFRVICQQGSFEPEIVNLLVRLARPRSTVFDVGANIGLMAIPVLRSCPTCCVVSFEPSPNSLPFLQRTANESGYGNRWTIVGKGLAHKSGELDFALGPPEEALYEGLKSGERAPDATVVRVPVSTLDEEWYELGKPEVSVAKIDVEGAEGWVLEGGAQLINACRPALIVEWHEPYLKNFGTSATQLLSLADHFGYRIHSLPGGVPIDDERTLRVQMMLCANFLLIC